MGGFGGSSYVDALILRDRDADLDQNAVLEERLYYCQSWRADVVAVVDSTGTLVEGARYSAYGVPFGVPAGDTNTDLTFDSTDSANITGWSPPASYDVRYDVNLDGAITSADASAAATVTLGRGVLSSAAIDNRRGYAGYEFWPAPAANLYSVRYRVLHSDLGRWTRRDPLAFVDGVNLYGYGRATPLVHVDPSGLACKIDFQCSLATSSPLGKCSRKCIYQCEEVPGSRRAHKGTGGCDASFGCHDMEHIGPITMTQTSVVTNWLCELCSLFGPPDCSPSYKVSISIEGFDCYDNCDKSDCLDGCQAVYDAAIEACDAIKNGQAKALCEAAAYTALQVCRTYCEVFCKELIETNATLSAHSFAQSGTQVRDAKACANAPEFFPPCTVVVPH
jgi:RHS repeat-associated protein